MTPSTTSADRARVLQRKRYCVPQLIRTLGLIAAWGWTILAGIGGLGLVITLGPWPPTNGWFALFSGLSACPLTAWLLKRCASINVPGWVRFLVAALFIVGGRFALKIEGRGTLLPDFH